MVQVGVEADVDAGGGGGNPVAAISKRRVIAGRCPKCRQFLRLPPMDQLTSIEGELSGMDGYMGTDVRCRKCGGLFPVSELITASHVPPEAAQFGTALRFYDRLMRSFQDILSGGPDALASDEHARSIGGFLGVMEDPRTKRILMDQRQAEIFMDLDEGVPDHIRPELHWPFDRLYLEFDGPVRLDLLLPNHLLRAMLIVLWPNPDRGIDYAVTVFHTSGAEVMTDTFGYGFRRGLVSDVEDVVIDPGRLSVLLPYLASYMMAKGIEIVLEPVTRQQRRLLARHKLPNPWHVIRVNPVVRDAPPPDVEDDGYQRRHGYRYDVMGHLRFGRHKLRDGAYRSTVEWVRPHQRGLRHELYIPAVRRFSGPRPPLEISDITPS